MKYQTVVCDIDGTLMPPDHGIVLKEAVAQAMRGLEERQVKIILASARAYAGILPIAKQLNMDHFGGYIIAENGASVYDVKRDQLLCSHEMAKDDVLQLWKLSQEYGVDFAFSQKTQMIASGFSKGFALDHQNCDIDYIVTNHPQALMQDAIMKCSLSAEAAIIAEVFPKIKSAVEEHYPYEVYYSTANIIDLLAKGCGKEAALQELVNQGLMNWQSTATIGDSFSDIQMIKQAQLGVSLTSAKAECRAAADHIVDSCFADGCLEFFTLIKNANEAKQEE